MRVVENAIRITARGERAAVVGVAVDQMVPDGIDEKQSVGLSAGSKLRPQGVCLPPSDTYAARAALPRYYFRPERRKRGVQLGVQRLVFSVAAQGTPKGDYHD